MKKRMRVSWIGQVLLLLLLTALSLVGCAEGSDGNINVIRTGVVRQAIEMQSQLYDDSNAKPEGCYSCTYNVNTTDYPMQTAINYWAQYLCGADYNANWQAIVASVSNCENVAPGQLQCVAFVLGAFGAMDNRLPVSGDGYQFWDNYQNQPGWTEVSPDDIFSGNAAPKEGDIVSFFNNDPKIYNPAGHVAIVVAFQAPEGKNDGAVVVASGNQWGNLSDSDRTKFKLPGGDFYKLTWHAQAQSGDQLFADPELTVRGFIRQVGYSSSPASSVAPASPVAPASSGAFPTCKADQPLVPVDDPYSDPLLKKLLGNPQFQLDTMRQLVDEAWCVAVHFDLPPQYFVLQVDEESGFQIHARSQVGATGLIQITPYTLNLVGNNGQNDSVPTRDCIYDLSLPPDCMSGNPITLDDANQNPLHNLEVGARILLDKLIYNLAPEGQQIDELQENNQRNALYDASYAAPLNAKVQACVNVNYSYQSNPDCLEGLARTLVSYNGGQSVTDGYNAQQMRADDSCKKAIPDQPTQWLQCVWDNQDTQASQHEAARYVINIFDFLPNYAIYCAIDTQQCAAELPKYPQPMLTSPSS